MKPTEIYWHPYQSLVDAHKDAVLFTSEHDKTVHIIYTSGRGFQIVPSHFSLDRVYYHGEQGKKMFFKFEETIGPNS